MVEHARHGRRYAVLLQNILEHAPGTPCASTVTEHSGGIAVLKQQDAAQVLELLNPYERLIVGGHLLPYSRR